MEKNTTSSQDMEIDSGKGKEKQNPGVIPPLQDLSFSFNLDGSDLSLKTFCYKPKEEKSLAKEQGYSSFKNLPQKRENRKAKLDPYSPKKESRSIEEELQQMSLSEKHNPENRNQGKGFFLNK